MFNYLIKIEYDGTNFAGWQSQKNSDTIQDNIELALKKTLRLKKKIRITGAGRTDKGVHAKSQFANFETNKKISKKKIFLDSFNFFLKNKLISILDIKEKKKSFNARHNAKLRTYEYLIINRQGSLAINKNKAWHVKKKINLKILKKGARILEGTHDFSTFRAASCVAKSPIKKIYPIKISKSKDVIRIKIRSKSFTKSGKINSWKLKIFGRKKWTLKKFKEVFKSKKRSLCTSSTSMWSVLI